MEETLLDKVIECTGLPKEMVQKSLNSWVLESGKSPRDLSLEDLREVLVRVMQDLFTEVADGENPFIRLSR